MKTIKNITGIFFLLVALLVSGCKTTQTLQQDLGNIPDSFADTKDSVSLRLL